MDFFTATGRLRRRSFLFRGLLFYALGVGFYALPSLLPHTVLGNNIKIVAVAGMMTAWYLIVIQTLKRLHDLDLSAWWALIGFLPVVGYVLGPGLQLIQGTVGPNRFGPDPKRPHLLPAVSEPPAADETENVGEL